MVIDKKNQFMVEGNHKIETLSESPRKKLGGLNGCARTDLDFYAAKNWKIIFKTHGFLQNVLRDFWPFSKIKNSPFSRPIYHQTVLDTEKKSYSTTIGTEKRKKCTSQIFYFWKFITHFFWWSEEHFSKTQNLWNKEKFRNLSNCFAKMHNF